MPEQEPDTVFVASNGSSHAPRTVHADKTCYRLEHATQILEKDIAVYPPACREWCSWCGPDGDDPAEYGAQKGRAD